MPTTFAISRKRNDSGLRRTLSMPAERTWNPSRTGSGMRFINPRFTLIIAIT